MAKFDLSGHVRHGNDKAVFSNETETAEVERSRGVTIVDVVAKNVRFYFVTLESQEAKVLCAQAHHMASVNVFVMLFC